MYHPGVSISRIGPRFLGSLALAAVLTGCDNDWDIWQETPPAPRTQTFVAGYARFADTEQPVINLPIDLVVGEPWYFTMQTTCTNERGYFSFKFDWVSGTHFTVDARATGSRTSFVVPEEGKKYVYFSVSTVPSYCSADSLND